jgi:hypothetical protein
VQIFFAASMIISGRIWRSAFAGCCAAGGHVQGCHILRLFCYTISALFQDALPLANLLGPEGAKRKDHPSGYGIYGSPAATFLFPLLKGLTERLQDICASFLSLSFFLSLSLSLSLPASLFFAQSWSLSSAIAAAALKAI